MLPTSTELLYAAARPSTWLLVLLFGGCALVLARRLAWGRRLSGLGLAGIAALLLLPLDDWALRPLEERIPRAALPSHITGIIVLGGGVDPDRTAERGIASLNADGERMLAAAILAQQHPEARLVFTGGYRAAPPVAMSEADVARMLFAGLGVAAGRLATEDASRNTHENAVLARRLLQPQPGESWVLVTSAAHMPRALGAFRRAGWNLLPWPVAFRTGRAGHFRFPPRLDLAEELAELDLAAHEWLGLLSYRLRGWTDAILPAAEAPAPGGASRIAAAPPE